MGECITKKELARQVYYEQDFKNPDRIQKFLVEDVLDMLVENIANAIVEDEKVYLRGFGTFTPIRRCLRREMQYCPGPGEYREVIRMLHAKIFKPSKQLTKKINVGALSVFERYFDNSNDS